MKKILLILFLVVTPFIGLDAQGDGGNRDFGRGQGRGPRNGPGPPPAVPIDGGLIALLAAGGLYGVKKLRDYNKDQ